MDDFNEEMDFSVFTMDTANRLYCYQCFSSPKELYISELKIVCVDCLDSNSLNPAIHEQIKIMNPGPCIIHGNFIGKWQCEKFPHSYCDICHMNNCLSGENSEFKCEPKPLFFTESMEKCSHCKKIIGEFKLQDSDSLVCHRCATLFFATSSKTKLNDDWINSTRDKYLRVLSEFKNLIQANLLKLAKFDFYKQEIQSFLKTKYLLGNRATVVEAHEDALIQYAVNNEKNQKAEKIMIFLNKEKTFNSLIENSGCEFKPFHQFLEKTLELKNDCELSLKMKLFTLTSETHDLVCSQENPECYTYPRIDESESESLPVAPSLVIQSPPFALKEIIEDPVTTTCIYARDPFYMYFLKPGCESTRRGLFHLLRAVQNPRRLVNYEIELGMELLYTDDDENYRKNKLDIDKFKRGRVERLISSGSNTFCIFAIDFGYKLALRIQNLFECPRELTTNHYQSNLFMGRLMGIKPLSNFSFILGNRVIDARTVISSLLNFSDKQVQIQRCFEYQDQFFVKVKTRRYRTLIDWTAELIKDRIGIQYSENRGCFIPKKRYCYYYHVMLKPCNENICSRIHECPYCDSGVKHTVGGECIDFANADKRFYSRLYD